MYMASDSNAKGNKMTELLNKQAYDLWIKFDALQNELFQLSQDAKNSGALETASGIEAIDGFLLQAKTQCTFSDSEAK